MGYVPPHMYILTGDKQFKKDFDKEQRFNVAGIIVSGCISFLFIIGGVIYSLLSIGG